MPLCIVEERQQRRRALLDESSEFTPLGAIRSGSHRRFRFGHVKMNNHSSFGVRRLVVLSPLWPGPQEEGGDKSPHSISDSLFVRLLRASCGSLTPTSNCSPLPF